MLVAYEERSKKQIEYYWHLCILNPQNWPDMPFSLEQYPQLGFGGVPEVGSSRFAYAIAISCIFPAICRNWSGPSVTAIAQPPI